MKFGVLVEEGDNNLLFKLLVNFVQFLWSYESLFKILLFTGCQENATKNKWPVLNQFEIELNEIQLLEDRDVNIICANFRAFLLFAAENIHNSSMCGYNARQKQIALRVFWSRPIPENILNISREVKCVKISTHNIVGLVYRQSKFHSIRFEIG